MDIMRIPGATRHLGAPPNWNPDTDGHCDVLPIRDELAQMVEGGPPIPMMTSHWKPSAEEIAKILAGKPIQLHVFGQGHPPVMLTVE